MTSSGYAEWARHHKTLLCIHNQEYDEMIREMEFIFRKMDATVDELDEASIFLWECPERSGSKWSQHGGYLRQFILRRRAEKAREREQADRKRTEQQFKGAPMDFAAVRAKLIKRTNLPEDE